MIISPQCGGLPPGAAQPPDLSGGAPNGRHPRGHRVVQHPARHGEGVGINEQNGADVELVEQALPRVTPSGLIKPAECFAGLCFRRF